MRNTITLLATLALATAATTPLHGCRLFRKGGSSQVKDATPAGYEIASATARTSANLSAKVADAPPPGYAFVITFADTTPAGSLFALRFSISPKDAAVFGAKGDAIEVPMSAYLRNKSGGEITIAAKKPIRAKNRRLGAKGVYLVNPGDTLEIRVDNPDAALAGASLFLRGNVTAAGVPTLEDKLSTGGMFLNEAAEFAAGPASSWTHSLTAGKDALYNYAVIYETSKAGTELHPDDDDICLGEVNATFEKPTLALPGGAFALPTPSTAIGTPAPGSPSAPPPCGKMSFQGAFEAKAGEPLTVAGMVNGLTPSAAFLNRRVMLTINTDLSGGTTLGTREMTIGTPEDLANTNMIGRWSKQKISLLLKGVRKSTGLKISGVNLSFRYPINVPSAMASSFDSNGVTASFLYASGPRAGTRVVDAAGTPLEVFKSMVRSKSSVGFEPTMLTEIEDGDYEIVFGIPDSVGVGSWIIVDAAAQRLREFVDPLAESVKDEFRKRDAAAGAAAAVHDWPRADYRAEYNPSTKERIPLVEIARAMEEIRTVFHAAISEVDPWTGAVVTPGATNTVTFGDIRSCLGNSAPHWSDLALHYYCLFGQLRSCYSNGIRATGDYMSRMKAEEEAKGGTEQAVKGAITCRLPTFAKGPATLPVVPFDKDFRFPTLRQYVFTQCSRPGTEALPNATGPANTIPGCFARTDIYALAPTQLQRDAFAWLLQDSKRAAVFRYIMEAPTLALDDKDQQDLINAFWRVKAPKDPAECAKRPRRAIDKRPAAGEPTWCEVGHGQDPPRAGIGR